MLVLPSKINDFMSLRYICLAVLSILALYVIIRERAFPNNRVLIPLGLFILFMFISTLKARDFEVAFWGIRNTFYVELTTPSPTLIPFAVILSLSQIKISPRLGSTKILSSEISL